MATLQSAGEFEIKFASITTSSGIELRIDASQLANVTFFENINQSAVTGSIQVFDSAALSSIGPLIGQEYFKLKILTPGQQEEIIDFTKNVLHIYKVSQRSRLSPNTQAYTLDFISSEGLKNTRIKLSRAVTGSYSEIVEKMLDEVNCKKKRFIEPTNELKKMVIANKYPFDVINMCKEKSISEANDSPTYKFFENFRGYHFRSLESMYSQAQQFVWKYQWKEVGSNLDRGLPIIKDQMQQIITYEVSGMNDTLSNSITGTLGSKLVVHDILNKSYTSHTYNMLDAAESEKNINFYAGKKGFPLYSETPIEPNTKISDYSSRQYLVPTTSVGANDAGYTTSNVTNPYTPNNPETWLQRRNSQMEKLNRGIGMKLQIYGNTFLACGDIVNVNIPVVAAENIKSQIPADQLDKLYKGNFLIKAIRHDFQCSESTHWMHMEIVKDCVEEKLVAVDDNEEPKPINNDVTEKQFYNQVQ